MGKPYNYSDFNAYNRFQNLDSIESLIVNHLVKSQTKHAKLLWKILKYDDMYALSKPDVTQEERLELVCNDNGDQTKKRVFFAPFVDDAWTEQCSSLYIFVENVNPTNHLKSVVEVTVETIVHSKISAIVGDGDPILNPKMANPNDSNEEGNIVVSFKNRATVLLKCVLAELNGLYINGIGYLEFDEQLSNNSKTTMPLFNNRSFYGHSTIFCVSMANVASELIEDPMNSL